MEEKTVYHIDVNSAYLSWEAVYLSLIHISEPTRRS